MWSDQYRPDPRYGHPFQGWFSDALQEGLQSVRLTGGILPEGSALVSVFSASSKISCEAQVVGGGAAQTFTVQKRFHELLLSLPTGLPIVSFVNGNEHARMMLGHLPAYDFLEPLRYLNGLLDGAMPIESSDIDRHVLPWVRRTAATLGAIRAVTRAPLVHVLPPPPRECPGEAEFMETLGDLVRKHGFAPDAVRLKWHQRLCRHLQVAAEELGCTVIWPPDECRTPAGLLRSVFAEGLTHGNASYGRVLATEVSKRLGVS